MKIEQNSTLTNYKIEHWLSFAVCHLSDCLNGYMCNI